MDNRYKRLVALLLVCVLMVGALPVYAVDFELPEDSLVEPVENLMYASFSSAVSADWKFSDGEGWHCNYPLGRYSLGAQWDNENIYLAIAHPYTRDKLTDFDVSVTINDMPVTLEADATYKWVADNIISSHREYTVCGEVAVALEDINVTVTDYGTQIPVKFTLGSDTWEGNIVLTSTVWGNTIYSNPGNYSPLSPEPTRGGTENSKYQKVESVAGGYRISDEFAAGTDNTPAVRLHARWTDLNAFNYLEFDMKIDSLPVYKLGESSALDYKYAVHGINWWMCRDNLYGISMGIINTEDGLIFVLRSDGPDQTVRLNRKVGDKLHLGCRWEENGSLTLFLDGEKLANLKNATMFMPKVGINMLDFVSLRSDEKATSASDDIDVTVTNIAAGNSYGEHPLDCLTFNDIKSNNTNQNMITQSLTLPGTLTGGPLNNGAAIRWESDAPNIIAADGKVKRPEASTKVTLTATCGTATKKFTLMVLGTKPSKNVLFVENDLKTATGAGVEAVDNFKFTLDQYNSSIIYYQGQSTDLRVNVIELTDSNASNRLNESVLTIWYSDDNITYTQLEDSFKILRKGNKTYLYDFEINARYIKVHCTHYDIHEADFTNTLKDMISVDYYIEETFNTTSQVVLENDTNKALYDHPHTIKVENAGVVTNKTDGSYSDVRFYLDGELLYHYFDGTNFVVRVPYITAYGVVKLTVKSGNVNAADISNKEYVHEVVYGTRESCDVNYMAYSNSKGSLILQNQLPHYLVAMPNNVMWGFSAYPGVGFWYKVSHDGGLTWSNNYERVTETVTVDRRVDGVNNTNDISDIRGAIYDDVAKRVIVVGYGKDKNGVSSIRMMYANITITNNRPVAGEWIKCSEITDTYLNVITSPLNAYSKPVKVSSYDGDGNGVDFVVPVHLGLDAGNQGMLSAIYSTDGGEHWILSDYRIQATGNICQGAEDGLTEPNILEDDKGRLVMLSRYQFGEIVNFAAAYSYDFGISWTTEEEKPATTPTNTTVTAKKSTVYTSNTQPSMYEYGGQDFLFWGGNNVLGGISYQRFPLNVAVSYDNMKTFENIQDIFSRYSMQGMTMGDRMYVTNQSVDSSIDDTVTLIWYHEGETNQTIVIDNFTDYFYRTKGAYDSFESSTVKYEGWSSVYGAAEIATGIATDGNRSMKIPGGVSVVRSIPYLQNGKIAFDLYLENASTASAQIEFESAYGTEYGKAAPIAFKINSGKLYFRDANGNDVPVAATLDNGWNHFEFELALAPTDGKAPSAKLCLNDDKNGIELPLDLSIGTDDSYGDYICYVDITTDSSMPYYVDSFLVQDMDVTRVPGETNEPEIYGHRILLGKNYAIDYYVEKAQFTAGNYKDPYMTFELNGKETTVTDYDEDGDYYVFTFANLAPNQMTEHIYATIHATTVADESAYTSDTTLFSIAMYCYSLLKDEAATPELRTLLVDILNYGAASQLYKDPNATNLANADLNETQRDWGSTDYAELELNNYTTGEEKPDVQWKNVSLVLQEAVVIRLYFTANDITDLSIKAEGAGNAWTIPASSFKQDAQGRYYADFGKLNPAQMREVISFTVFNGDAAVSNTFHYSIESYVYSKIYDNKSEPALERLVESMIKYGDAAQRYVISDSRK